MATQYHVYGSPSSGAPIDYTTPLATTISLSWPTPALAAGVHRFGVRAFDTVSGLEESNVDAAVTITVSAGLADMSAVPAAPRGLAAVPTAAGGAHVAWDWPLSEPWPTGFRVYLGSPTPNYTTPAATVPVTVGRYRYATDLTGLSEGTPYQVAVRAYNAVGEEANTTTVNVTGSTSAPSNVVNLVAS